MGSVKHMLLEESQRNYERNRYYHERKKLNDRMRLHAGNPGFVAILKRELEALEQGWKDRREKSKKR